MPNNLINVNFKIFAKILAKRSAMVLLSIINAGSSTFIKNRLSYNNVKQLLKMIILGKNKAGPITTLSYADKKAIDRNGSRFLFYMLQSFQICSF